MKTVYFVVTFILSQYLQHFVQPLVMFGFLLLNIIPVSSKRKLIFD